MLCLLYVRTDSLSCLSLDLSLDFSLVLFLEFSLETGGFCLVGDFLATPWSGFLVAAVCLAFGVLLDSLLLLVFPLDEFLAVTLLAYCAVS